MLVTVTANTTLDQTVFIPQWQASQTIRATKTAMSMGGKPTDAAWILGKIQIPSLALGFAAGAIGDQIARMLNSRGVITDFVPVGGVSRMNTVIVEEQAARQTTITTSSLVVEAVHIEQLYAKYTAALADASCVVLGGTLPQGIDPTFYTDLIRWAREREMPVIFDADEPNLSAGLRASPTYVKPNEHELEHLLGYPVDSLEAAYRAGRTILDRYGTVPVVTLGERGMLAVLPDRAYHIPPIPVAVVSNSGAGDGVLAGIARSILAGESIENGLKYGAAFATAVLRQAGTAEYDPADMAAYLKQVQLVDFKV